MKLPNPQLTFKLLYDISINLTSGWFGVVLVSPGFFGVNTVNGYVQLLLRNVPFGIVNLIISYWFLRRSTQ